MESYSRLEDMPRATIVRRTFVIAFTLGMIPGVIVGAIAAYSYVISVDGAHWSWPIVVHWPW